MGMHFLHYDLQRSI